MSDFEVDYEVLQSEDIKAMTAHPEAVLTFGEMWTCSCGLTSMTFTMTGTVKVPLSSFCPHCGDVAIWQTVKP